MTPIHLHALTKHFGSTVAVDGVDLHIPSGELFFLLGPSGCGKTTLLRMLAGFADPTSGVIRFGEREVTHLPPNRRNTGMVFQGYALWPHMTVRQNVAFGLDVRKVDAKSKSARTDRALSAVRMLEYADRKPNQLSGGQQQRVALARALVIEPTVLLLDEPLSNLDAKLRIQMRSQIREICRQSGITAVYVTHDQKEALSMADRVAVMRQGKVVQADVPRQLYLRPNSRFVADFLGETNFVSAQVLGREQGQVVLETPAGRLYSSVFPQDMPVTGNVTCSIRPEALQLRQSRESGFPAVNTFTARREQVVYLGEVAQHHLAVGDQLRLRAFELNPRLLDGVEDALQVHVDPREVVILND